MKERMGEVIHKAAELRKDNEDLKDSISKSDELIANLKIEVSWSLISSAAIKKKAELSKLQARYVDSGVVSTWRCLFCKNYLVVEVDELEDDKEAC